MNFIFEAVQQNYNIIFSFGVTEANIRFPFMFKLNY